MAKESARKDAAGKPAPGSSPPGAAAASGAPGSAGASAGKGGLKVAIVVVLVLLLEVGTVVVTMMLTGGPKSVQGHHAQLDPKAEETRLVELMVIKDQFPNQRTGRVYLYDTEIWITVQKRDADRVKNMVQNMQASIATDLGVIYRRADPSHLTEPTLATLTRQVKASLDDRIGRDAEGNPLIQEALIKKCIQVRVDG